MAVSCLSTAVEGVGTEEPSREHGPQFSPTRLVLDKQHTFTFKPSSSSCLAVSLTPRTSVCTWLVADFLRLTSVTSNDSKREKTLSRECGLLQNQTGVVTFGPPGLPSLSSSCVCFVPRTGLNPCFYWLLETNRLNRRPAQPTLPDDRRIHKAPQYSHKHALTVSTTPAS